MANKLANRVRIVRVGRHDRTVRVRIEELQRKRLHAIEHVITHLLERALSDDCHQTRVDESAQNTRAKDDAHDHNQSHELRHHGRESLAHTGNNHGINDLLEEDRANRRCDTRNHNADADNT